MICLRSPPLDRSLERLDGERRATTPRRFHISGRFRFDLRPWLATVFSTSVRATFSRAGAGTYAFVP